MQNTYISLKMTPNNILTNNVIDRDIKAFFIILF